MARGWESKSVEEQQNQATHKTLTDADKAQLNRERAEKMRKVQALQLTRARIREQLERSTNERYNEMLKRELEHVDSQLKALES